MEIIWFCTYKIDAINDISDDSDDVTMENIALSNEEEHEGQSLSYVDVVLRNANNQQDQVKVIQKRLSW